MLAGWSGTPPWMGWTGLVLGLSSWEKRKGQGWAGRTFWAEETAKKEARKAAGRRRDISPVGRQTENR